MRGAAAALLVFEVIVIGLGALLAASTTDISTGWLWAGASALALLCIVAAGTLGRGSIGLVLGSVVQILVLAAGFVVPAMFILGLVFGGLWVMAIVLGRRIAAVQAAHRAAQP